jgi:phosphatidylserine/phosphatidylglycerophosphate/cardiolipin synthase-like enzyme
MTFHWNGISEDPDSGRIAAGVHSDQIDKLVQRALDPADPGLRVVAWPGQRLACDPGPGDLLVRRAPGQRPYIAVLSGPSTLNLRDAQAAGLLVEGPWPGHYVRVVEIDRPERGAFARRIAGPNRLVLPDTIVLRPSAEAIEPAGALPPPAPHPTIRAGSSGPAVAEAQHKLNAFHAQRIARGESAIDSCPLDVDGRFGRRTRAAAVAFQRIVFPDQPTAWDGVIGPRTWTQLDVRAPAPDVIDPPIAPPAPPRPPISPVVSHPLEPDRWGPILRAAASSNAHLRTGNAVRALIDGIETFNAMVIDIKATRGDSDYIYLLGWDMFDDFELIPGDATTTVRRLFSDASGRGVQIRAMLWDQPGLQNTFETRRIDALPNGAAILDDETVNKTPMSTARLGAALLAAGIAPGLIPVIIPLIAGDLPRLTGSHHQKVLVVKHGETLVAYCGGIDLNPNRISAVARNSGQPHHDTHCRVVGPSAWDLLDTFIRRWRHHPDSAAKDRSKGPLRGASEPVPSPIARPSRADAPFGGPTSVIVARTFNPTHAVSGIVRERDIQVLLRTAIANARSFIYLEDQYLVDLDTANALRTAIPRLNHVTILILGNALNDYPFGAEHRRDFVDRMTTGLSGADLAKVGVFQLATSPSTPTFGPHTYVHSKTWVVDDELAVIGSANCNRRGYQHDSEVDAFIFDDTAVSPLITAGEDESAPLMLGETVMLTPTFAQQYRMRLWAEHLGMPGTALLDGVASAAFWRGARPSTARIIPFNHRLPSGAAQTVRNLAANALRFIIDPVP